MDKRPSEKRISSQHELICIQANIIALKMQSRIKQGRFYRDAEDLDKLLSGIENFCSELKTLRAYLKEARE